MGLMDKVPMCVALKDCICTTTVSQGVFILRACLFSLIATSSAVMLAKLEISVLLNWLWVKGWYRGSRDVFPPLECLQCVDSRETQGAAQLFHLQTPV